MSQDLDLLIPSTVLDEFDRVPSHLTKLLVLLEHWEERCTNELDAWKPGSIPKAPLASQIDKLAKVSVSMAKELREWQKKRKAVISSLSMEDKLLVSMRLIQGLSVGDRLKFYGKVNEVERSRKDGGIKLAVTHV